MTSRERHTAPVQGTTEGAGKSVCMSESRVRCRLDLWRLVSTKSEIQVINLAVIDHGTCGKKRCSLCASSTMITWPLRSIPSTSRDVLCNRRLYGRVTSCCISEQSLETEGNQDEMEITNLRTVDSPPGSIVRTCPQFTTE